MSNEFEFVAESRGNSGKIAARAARRIGKVPAVVYGGEGEPQTIMLAQNEVVKHLNNEAVYSHLLDLNIDGKSEKAVLKDVQRHPVKPQILHLDFMRVSAKHELKIHVPLHFINEESCVGVKAGGVITHSMVDLEVTCLPKDLPEFIEIDLSGLEVGDSIHISDIKLPSGVESVALAQEGDHDHVVAQVMKTRVAAEDEGDSAEGEESSTEE